MKNLILLIFLIAFTIPSIAQKNKKFKPEKDMVGISVIEGEYEMKVGDKFYYSGHTHGSVGEEFSLSYDSDAFKQIDKHFCYDDPKKAEMSGGDGGTRTYTYQVLKKGEYTLVIKDLFRGDVKNTYEVKIKVVE